VVFEERVVGEESGGRGAFREVVRTVEGEVGAHDGIVFRDGEAEVVPGGQGETGGLFKEGGEVVCARDFWELGF